VFSELVKQQSRPALSEFERLHEIGVTYRIKDSYYIAITHNLLLTATKGKSKVVRTAVKHKSHEISVEILASLWGLTLDEFDTLLIKFIKPICLKRAKTPRHKKFSIEEFYRSLRTAEFSY